jgi:TM2 domain-containing membrane protein YozV
MKWEKNKEWELKMEIYGLIILMTIILLWGAIGWHRYRQEWNYNEGFEITQFEPLGGI